LVRLKTIAKERGLRGYSKYNGSTKQELVDLINNSWFIVNLFYFKNKFSI
jgi:hypothetical protein